MFKEWRLDDWMIAAVTFLSALFFVTIYADWFYPPVQVVLTIFALSGIMYGIVQYQKGGNKKELILLSNTLAQAMVWVSTYSYHYWEWESIITNRGMSLVVLTTLIPLAVYIVVGYVRLKVNYKSVRGNQRHSQQWKVTKGEKKKLENSKDIFVELGEFYEKPEA
ncbi:hypothetical protein H0266_18205 [Halobacillus locisalis]|uniref:Uncharacterized protein n=1 Tax=Halobacillus locisalis TaxID=220753 RepID=A0A838CYL2_9BACI|nr:hypothetical protein [Halobacillus locisalis]MBA2176815.1 hypothetical protein [Halobacillus locisalis]